MNIAELVIGMSQIILGPTDYPGATAQVQFFNTQTNGPQDNLPHTISNDDIDIGVLFTFNADAGGQDRITVTPPPGWTCKPADCTLTVMEGYDKVLYLFEWVGY